jgi:hypothetical protein
MLVCVPIVGSSTPLPISLTLTSGEALCWMPSFISSQAVMRAMIVLSAAFEKRRRVLAK